MRTSSAAYLLAALLSVWAATSAAAGDAPRRVVSINLCTDQLAMLLAADGQLHSVSNIARDPRMSAMVEEASNYVINHGRAEEIYMMRPDLVLAGPYTSRATTAILEELGIPVAVIPVADTLADVRTGLLRMGEALHREATAQAMAREFDTRLARLRQEVRERPGAILYYANGLSSGDSTLAGQILLAAGFENAAAEADFAAGKKLPLEVLAMTAPETVITPSRYPGASRSEAILDHPAVQALRRQGGRGTMVDRNWVCGTPHVLRAIERLAQSRRALTGAAR